MQNKRIIFLMLTFIAVLISVNYVYAAHYEYDKSGRLVQVDYSNEQTTRSAYYNYDKGGNIKGVTGFQSVTETPTETTTETGGTVKFIFGGACAEKNLSATDAAAILQKVLNSSFKTPIEKYTDDYVFYLDVDRSGSVDSPDAMMVLQKVLVGTYKFKAETELMNSTS